jgi:hypothetical protein
MNIRLRYRKLSATCTSSPQISKTSIILITKASLENLARAPQTITFREAPLMPSLEIKPMRALMRRAYSSRAPEVTS